MTSFYRQSQRFMRIRYRITNLIMKRGRRHIECARSDTPCACRTRNEPDLVLGDDLDRAAIVKTSRNAAPSQKSGDGELRPSDCAQNHTQFVSP